MTDLPKLRSLSDEKNDWQIKPDAWVSIFIPVVMCLRDRFFMFDFAGGDFAAYLDSPEIAE